MGHPLEQRVEAVRRQALRLLRRGAALQWLAATLLVVAAALSIDALFRFEDRGLRVIVAGACWVAVGWLIGRLLWPSFSANISALQVALRVEDCFPELKHRLASAIEFLAQPLDDELAGSAALRRGVVIDAQALSEGVDYAAVIDRRPARRAAWLCGGVIAMLSALVAADFAIHLRQGRPATTVLALKRLLLPWNSVEWPRTNHFAVRKAVDRVALGDVFEVEVVDLYQTPLPDDARIEFRTNDASTVISAPLQIVDKVTVARREQVEQPFAYRIVGGDDHTFPWTEVQVLAPPKMARLQVKLHYPTYLGWQPEASPPLVRAWRGTRVELNGDADLPLNSATICLESGARLPATLSKDRRSFQLAGDAEQPFVVENTDAYWIELESTDGIRGGANERYEVRALVDVPPRVTTTRPAANIFVTATAVVPVDVAVADDLAIHEIGLRYTRTDQTDVEQPEIPVFQGPADFAAPRSNGLPTGDERRATYDWNLGTLALSPGMHINLVAFASDYLPQEGTSTERRLSIITPEELLDRLAERQTLVLNELARLLRLQHEAHAQIEGVQVEWKHVGELQASNIERLAESELLQRQVTRGLTDAREGVPAQVAAAIADLEMNRLDHPDSWRQLIDIRDTLKQLGDGPLTNVERAFTSSIKRAQQARDETAADATVAVPEVLNADVTQIDAGQRQCITELEALLARLTRWDALRRQLRELAQLKQDQAGLANQTLEIGRQTLARSLRDLAPQERAELERLSLAQGELARRLDNAMQALGQAAADLESADPTASQTIHDALANARRDAVSGAMRSAGQGVAENQIGQAAELQERAVAAIDSLLNALTNRREQELTKLVDKLRKAEAELNQLRDAQTAIGEKLAAAAQDGEQASREALKQLSAEQRELMEAAHRQSRELERLQATDGAKSVDAAAESMQNAATNADANATQYAAEQAEQAKRDLEAAQRAVAEARQQAEQQMAEQTLQQLQESLRLLADRQQQVLTSTEQLETRRRETGAWSRAELTELRALSQSQQELSATTGTAAEGVAASPVFQHALQRAAESMRSASARLAEQDAGEVTQQAERRALGRIAQLRDALKQEPSPPNDKQNPAENSASPEGEPAESAAQPKELQRLAELKMLKLLQVEVYDSTKGLEERLRRQGNLTAEERLELEQLSAEQAGLADMLRQMQAASAESEPEDAVPPPEPEASE